MKKINLSIALVLLSGLLLVTSCKKKDDMPATPDDTEPAVTIPADAKGSFIAVSTLTYQTTDGYTNSYEVGTASAWFGTPSAWVDAGNVMCDGYTLTKQANNGYIFTPNSSNPNGINFGDPVTWEVTGNSANGVPVIGKNDNGYFPYIQNIVNTGDIATNAAYTLSAESYLDYSDSVIFVVAGPNARIVKVKGPNAASCTFTAAEMNTLGTGTHSGLVQIAPFTIEGSTVSGKKYYFVKETVVSKIVNLK